MASRTVTGISAVPAGVAGTGTVTADTADAKYLRGTGTNFLDLVPKGETRNGKASRYYVFIPAKSQLIKIIGFISNTLLLLEATNTASADPYQIVKADLQSFRIANQSATAGLLDGQAFAGNAVFESPVIDKTNQYQPQPPHWVNATGTTFLIIENP
jgi:hypothetical protein